MKLLPPTAEELLHLDLLTLSEHTTRAGDRLDPNSHLARLRDSMRISRVCHVRRRGELVAYAMLSPMNATSWFVRGFNTHPTYRNAAVLRALLKGVSNVASAEAIIDLTSNVYKTNRLSMAFHRKLGFRVTRENDKGVEFFTTVKDLMTQSVFQRVARLESSTPLQQASVLNLS